MKDVKYLVLDDEIIAAEYLAALIREVDEKAEVVTEINPVKSLELARQQFDVCFIDTEILLLK